MLVDKFEHAIGRDENVMLITADKNGAAKYHEEARKHREKTEQQERNAKAKL